MRLRQKLNNHNRLEIEEFIKDKKHSSKAIKKAQAILMLDQGISLELISDLTGYQRRQIFGIRKKYLEKGIIAIADKEKNNPKELLTKKERAEIINLIKTKKPSEIDSYYRNFDYWTTGVLAHYIAKEYEVKYKSKTSIYIIFRQSKFTYHKPGRIYKKRDGQEVKNWRDYAKLIIKKALNKENTVILCEDEMVLSTQTTFQKIWLPVNDYPKIEVSNTKKNKSIYGFLNIKTGVEHAFKKDWQNMFITVEVLKKLRKIYPTQQLLIFWDGAGWHRGSKTQEFIKKDKNIETIYFPKYAPEENPQEHVWKKGRAQITNNRFIENIETATNEFVDYLNKEKFNYNFIGLF